MKPATCNAAIGVGLNSVPFFKYCVRFVSTAIKLQKNNPEREIHTGNGVHYTVDYTYDYSDKMFPWQIRECRGSQLSKRGGDDYVES